jgi:hypothetical protein
VYKCTRGATTTQKLKRKALCIGLIWLLIFERRLFKKLIINI